MNIFKIIGQIGFFIHYYLIICLTTLYDVCIHIFNRCLFKRTDKQYRGPFEKAHQHVFLETDEAIAAQSFIKEDYQFQTKDGAIIRLWRVKSINHYNPQLPYPIVLQHGLLDCSTSWFLLPDKSKCLPYVLAEAGYDVWIGNNRGTRHNTSHVESSDFWNYSFDELVEYDQPTIIEGVLDQTKKHKIIYIGHSQGSTQFLLGMGIHSELQHKIAAFIGFGSVISLSDVKDHMVLNIISKFYLLELAFHLGFKTILHLTQKFSRALAVLIYNHIFYHNFMMKIVYLLCGKTKAHKIANERFGVMIAHEPGGASIKNVMQWVQCFRRGKFCRFNHGKAKNMSKYGVQESPEYNAEHLKTLPFHSYLFRGSADSIIGDKDFEYLVSRFDDSKITAEVIQDYNHLDYLWSVHAKEDLYDKILPIVNAVSTQPPLSKPILLH